MKTDLTEQQLEYEQRVVSIVGKRIVRIQYYEIAYSDGQPYWDRGQFHSLDFGLDFLAEDGSTYHIFWNHEFFQYEISLAPGLLFDPVPDAIALWDVTEHPNWQPLLHSLITRVQTYWSHVEFTTLRNQGSTGDNLRQLFQKPQRLAYPQDLVLEFASGKRAFFSAAQYFEDQDKLFGISDEVTVIFSDQVAARYKVGPYASFE